MNKQSANVAAAKSAHSETKIAAPPIDPAASPKPGPPDCDFALEMRFAVVMYGGVSLAIYIHGVAWELLQLVRATASADPKRRSPARFDALSGSASVYREVARLIRHPAVPEDGSNDALRIRFVVDIISGTSAGGINGVFLAKALANDQDMSGLKKLWIQEGDISRLINDGESLESLVGLRRQRPPRSLLNSGRMYCKLLEALKQMETAAPSSAARQPLVDELDLFLTTTDIRGLQMPIQLADKPVDEMRYRNVFHLRASNVPSAPNANHFIRDNDPFLAFMARCTSSFPFAFEPMNLSQVLDAAIDFPEYQISQERFAGWKEFYPDYEADAEFQHRQFGDGGYLDNKPFTYATQKLMQRWAHLPVERKLLYVEPNPELSARRNEPGASAGDDRGVNVIENVKAALFDLPTYETIREDLERLNERNRLLERVRLLIARVEEDVLAHDRALQQQSDQSAPRIDQKQTEVNADNWAKTQDLADMTKSFGVAYGSYHRLKVHEATAHLAAVFTQLAGFDATSDECIAIRLLLETWRDARYAEYRSAGTLQTQNQFLLDYDLPYRLRRLHFLNRKINELAVLDQHADDLLDVTAHDLPGPTELRLGDFRHLPRWREQLAAHADPLTLALWKTLPRPLQAAIADGAQPLSSDQAVEALEAINAAFLRDRARPLPDVARRPASQARANRDALQNAFPHQLGTSHFWPVEKPERAEFSAALSAAKEALCKALSGLSMLEYEWKTVLVGAGDDQRPLPVALRELRVESGEPLRRSELNKLLTLKGAERAKRITELVTANETLISEIMDAVVGVLSKKLKKASADVAAALNVAPDASTARQAVGLALRFLYKNFEKYDQVLFPVLFGTEAGETSPVQVYRISPLDAGRRTVQGREKLRGTFLANFGAFLAQEWRRNDLLWGRLDGAERLITILLGAGHPRTEELIDQAHAAIVSEELRESDSETWMAAYDKAWQHVATELEAKRQRADLEPRHQAVMKLLREGTSATVGEKRLELVLRTFLNDEALLKSFDERPSVTRKLEPAATARALGRATAVIGDLLSGLAASYDQSPAPGQWIARLGKIFWGFVEMAVPQSLLGLLFRHWLGVLYLLELLMIGGGMIFPGAGAAQNLGWNLLALTAAVHAVAGLTSLCVRQWHTALKLLAAVVVLILTALALFGGYHVWQLGVARPKLAFVAFAAAAGLFLVWIILLEIQQLRGWAGRLWHWLLRLIVLLKK
jgi:patatin-related protein